MTEEQQELKDFIHNEVEQLSHKWKISNSDTIEIGCRYCNHPKNFSISLSKHIFHCWACDESGTIYSFLYKYYPELLQSYSSIYKIKRQVTAINNLFGKKSNVEYIKQEIDIPNNLVHISDAERVGDIVYGDFFNFLYNKRYLSRELCYKYNVHFQLSEQRVWFLSYDKLSNLNFAVSRNIKGKASYMNYGKRESIIFNEYMVNFNEPIFLFEGVLDAIRIQNSVPLLGMMLSEDSLLYKMIIMHNATCFFMLDKGLKEKQNAIKNCDNLLSFNPNLDLYIGEIVSNHKDIGEMEELDIKNFIFYKYDEKYKFNNLLKSKESIL